MASVRIYTIRGCPFCARAKTLLNRYGVHYQEQDVTNDPPMRGRLAAITGSKTVPQTFVNGRAIGGATDLERLDRQGRLSDVLGT